jgi:GNAT superfamily N-acetyltransferase
MPGLSDPAPKRGSGAQIVLRASDPEDRSRAREVQWAVGWKEPPERHHRWPEADADWQARHYFREVVAEVDGVIAGRIGLEAYRQPFAELMDLCVRPDYRRLGLAQQLMLSCEREAARRGFSVLFVQTERDNREAHRLYTGLDFVPTALGKMLRMVKFIDFPLLNDFRRTHPLNQYACTPIGGAPRAWNLEWHAYVTDDYLRLRLEGGASQSDSEGIGPALTGCDWSIGEGERALSLRIQPETLRGAEPGHHIEMEITLVNQGRRVESGIFQMGLPPGLRVSSPETNMTQVFAWQANPGEQVTQPVVVQIEPTFDLSPLQELNYKSVPVCMETYWEGHRALLSVSLPMAAP